MDFSGVKSITIPEGNVKKITCGQTELWSAETLLPVGGTIFYITSGSNGATYTFYDANFNEVTPTVKSSPVWYKKEGQSTADKYYVTNSTMRGNANFQYSPYTFIDGTGSAIGTGRSNTQIIINKIGTPSGSCWSLINADNINKYNGCDDWYIPSINEAEQIYKSNLVVNKHIISSTEINSDNFYMYNAYTSYKRKESSSKQTMNHAFSVRSF